MTVGAYYLSFPEGSHYNQSRSQEQVKPREHLKHEARLAHLKTMHRIQKQGLHVCTIGDTILCGYITIRSIFSLSSRSRNGGGIGSLEHWQELLLPCVSTVRSLKALLPLLEPCHLLDAPYCRRQNPLNPPYTLALTQPDTKMPETGLSHVWQILELTLPAKALTEQRRLTVWIWVCIRFASLELRVVGQSVALAFWMARIYSEILVPSTPQLLLCFLPGKGN